jgi:hypothetical protein
MAKTLRNGRQFSDAEIDGMIERRGSFVRAFENHYSPKKQALQTFG